MKRRILEQSIFGATELTEANRKLFVFLEHKDPSKYDQIMDHLYRETHIGGGLHRSFDASHTFAGSYSKIRAATGDVQFTKYSKALFNDFVTPQGLPLFNLNRGEIEKVTNEISHGLGGHISAGQLRSCIVDMDSINAGEAVCAGVGCVFLAFAIKSGDSKAISRTTAINLCLGIATGNPIQVFTGLSGLAYGLWVGKISAWDMLVGAIPTGAALIAAKAVGGVGGILAGIVTGVGTAALIGHLEEQKQKKIKAELGNNRNYIAVMSPWLIQKELELLNRKYNNTLTVYID